MATASFSDRVMESTTTTGTGTLTLAGAVTGFQTFATIGDGNTTPMAVWEVDANGNPSGAWEVARTCTYTAAGTTLTRGTFLASSTGAAVSFAAGTKYVAQALPAAILNGLVTASKTSIAGLLVTKTSAQDKIDVSAGSCYDPSSDKVISYAGATAIAVGTLGASQWNQVYIYDNAGTATIEVTNNAAPPSTTYAGTARQGGTNSNRRWIGSFLTSAASAIYAHDAKEVGQNAVEVIWLQTTNATPFRVLSAGTSTTYVAVSLVGIVPRYAVVGALLNHIMLYVTTGLADLTLSTSVDGTNYSTNFRAYCFAISAGIPQMELWAPVEAATPQLYYKMTVTAPGAGPQGSLDVIGYRIAR